MRILIPLLAVLIVGAIGAVIVYVLYRKDIKKLGRDNLAVSLSERMFDYLSVVVIPTAVAFVGGTIVGSILSK